MSVVTFLMYAGLLLLPISIGSVESGTMILSIGIPILAIPSLVGFGRMFISSHRTWKIPIWLWGFFIFSVLAIISCVFSPDFVASFYRAVINLEVVGMVLYMYQENEYAKDSVLYRKMTYMLALSGTILGVEYSLHFFYKALTLGFGEVIADRVVGGLAALNWGASNTVAACLLITSLTTLGLALRGNYSKSQIRNLYLMFSIQLLATGLTVSRTVIIILAVTSFVTYVRSRGVKNSIYIMCGIGLAFAIAVALYTGDNEGLQEVIRNRMETDSVTSMSGRTEIWAEYLLNVWQNHGLPSGYYSAIYRNDFSGHNNYLTLLYEMGLCGLLFAFLTISAIFHTAHSKNNLHFAALTAVALNLMAEDLIYLQVYNVYFWLLLSLGYMRYFPAEITNKSIAD